MATLTVLQGPDKGRTMRTTGDVVLLGRGSSQVPLTDPTISRRHAELQLIEGKWTLIDLGSANGTYINGARVQKPKRLKHGDQIRVGSTLMVYTGDESTQHYSGKAIPDNLVTLDAGSVSVDATVVASTPSNDDSMVLAAPEAADAVKAWNIMRELSNVIGSLLPLDQLLARVLDIIFEEVDVDRAVIFLRDAETEELLPEVVRFRDSAEQQKTREAESIIASRTIMKHVIDSREGVLCSNVVTDERFQSGKSVHNLGMRSVICAPIVAREQILGVLHLDCAVKRHTYSEGELRLITAIGYQAGLAIENARLVQSHLQRERLAAAGETVAYLSHYIKNILQGMRSGADVVERGLKKRDLGTTAQGWRIVERNLDRSYNLMLNMLAFSKERQPRLEPLQINRIVEDVVELVQRQADEKKVMVLSDLDEHVPPISLDYDGVHQVVLNIVTNAIDAVEGGAGRVNVQTHFDDAAHEATIQITDNGPGVPAALRGRVFEPFHSSKGHGGTGLGLAVARKIVEELGGTIELHDPPDGGAAFRVTFAAGEAEPPAGDDTRGPSE
jgi:two-component system NtrC family sensor kinase